MNFLQIGSGGDPGMLFIAVVAFVAGAIRGFTGFGGPAFIVAILTLFFTPFNVVSKILVIDFCASIYLFRSVYRDIDWRATACMVIPTLLFMPIGHWLLLTLDPLLMKRAIAIVIAAACIAMLIGYRYQRPMTTAWLIFVGVISGIVFGGSYIALVTVVVILLGPYNKNQGRALIVSWSFFTVLGFATISGVSGTTGFDDIITAAPAAATYLLGAWLGTRGFHRVGETLFRRAAIGLLLLLALFNLVL